jgi:hypothetical protein
MGTGWRTRAHTRTGPMPPEDGGLGGWNRAICVHGRHRLAIGILDLPMPSPRPDGSEWFDAYRRWAP